MSKINVLFVCLGNICRSPSAEAVFKDLLCKNNLENQFYVDSAGTSGFHAGEKADPRMRETAKKRGFEITSISRQFNSDDFNKFDFIIGMDESNIANMSRLSESQDDANKLFKMTDFASNKEYDHVPDPYYGGPQGFDLVMDLLDDCCKGLLKHIQNEKNL